jgi:hypothetical protein
VLARLKDRQTAVSRVVRRIAGLETTGRERALRQLMILAGLRRLEETVEREIKRMPVLLDILDHKVLGREFKRGKAEGVQEGEQTVLRRMMAKRFGEIPGWAEEALTSKSAAELEALCERLLDVTSIEELLR